jgi:hypothetical protein
MRPEDRPLEPYSFNPHDDQLERLDALLTARRMGRPAAARIAPDDLASLLTAADALTPLADAQPSAEFAARLEAQLMARAGTQGATQSITALPPTPRAARHASPPPRRRLTQLAWAAVAACVLLGMTVGALTASAHPGAPFYTLRKAVEGFSSDLTGASVATARDDLQRVSAALVAFNTAVSRGDNAAAQAALDQLTQANHQAADAIAQVGDSSQRAALQSQLDSLHTQEITDLRAALPNLGWPARIQITNALRTLKAAKLTVTSARIAGAHEGDTGGDGNNGNNGNNSKSGGLVTVIVKGSGFTSGAVLLINGQQAGAVDAITPDTLVAHLPAGTAVEAVSSVGVGEPDGSAASTTHIEADGHSNQPDATATSEPGDHATPNPGSTTEPGDGGDKTPTPGEPGGATPTPSGSDH